ncbi:MAG: cob(I)yrinic acid a,c-diamide adenosyltransferase [Gammaproteobacteria bacterium]|nr:cob(I)yrinic acid a,c-diamide adenosyltransferase [Gammaproteobacteria bacterium]
MKSGDDGFTSLANGKRVKKYSDIIEIYGSLDEVNVFLGYVAEALYCNQEFSDLLKQVYRIQRDLFELGSYLMSGKKFTINPQKISILEMEIDAMSERLPVLKSFILPGGGESASRIHLTRAVCRRAERIAFKLLETNDNAEIVGIYLNRLGDWLYVAARTAAFLSNEEEMQV